MRTKTVLVWFNLKSGRQLLYPLFQVLRQKGYTTSDLPGRGTEPAYAIKAVAEDAVPAELRILQGCTYSHPDYPPVFGVYAVGANRDEVMGKMDGFVFPEEMQIGVIPLPE